MRRIVPAFLAALLVLAAGPGTPRAAPQERAHWSDATRRVVLENGLTVLLLQRGDLPVVSVQALYRFGSRNERPGLTGSAHYIEHMAFRATEEIGKRDLTNQILRWGGRWNGYTNYDQTVYGSHTPSEYLAWLIYLERQRIRHVLFDPAEVELERTSVIAEEHQYRNSPAYVMTEHHLRRTALVAHPYGSPIMGRLPDLQGVTAEEMARLYRQYYAPNNLILAIVGWFDPEEALALVRTHFGDLAADGEATAIRTVEPDQHGERRVVVRGRGSASYLSLLVHAPAARDETFATLLALDGVLAGGKAPGRGTARNGSRLHRALVEPGLAASVSTEVELNEYPSVYEVRVTAAADADLGAIEARLDRVFSEAAAGVTSEEVTRAIRQVQADMAFGAASNRAVANLLSVYEQLDSFALLAELPRRLDAVDAQRVRAFARERLSRDRRSIGTFVPDASPAAAGTSPDDKRGGPAAQPVAPRASSREIPRPRLEIPELPAPTSRTLPNGLRALALRMPGEFVHLRVRIAAGSVHDPAGEEGTALLTARLLGEGSGSRPSLAAALGDRQVRVTHTALQDDEPFANREFVEIGATLFPGALTETLQALAAAVTDPSLEEAFGRASRALAGAVAGRQDDSRWRANRAAFEALFGPGHPHGRPPDGTAASRADITLEDVRGFHRAHYRPDRVVVAIAGAIEPDAALRQVQAAFGPWRAAADARPAATRDAPPGRPAPAAAPSTPGPRRVQVPLDTAQASLAVALPGVARDSPDYVPLAALNYLLGETGYAGRLGDALVDTGIAYAVYASVLAGRQAGPIFVTTDAVRSREATDLIVRALDGFARNGVTEPELREAQGFLLGRLLFRFESPQAASATLAEIGYFEPPGGPGRTAPRDPLREFARAVLALTVADLNRAAARYYDPSRAVVAIAGQNP
jgi:zinc protease